MLETREGQGKKRTRMKTHKNSKKLVVKRSKVRREQWNIKIKFKLKWLDSDKRANAKTQWRQKKMTYKWLSKWANQSLTLKITNRKATCSSFLRKTWKQKKV
jgi:hypothetical protein